MDRFEQEPQPRREEQVLGPARIAATAAAALPAVGFGLLCLSQGIAEARRPATNCTFHLMLGAALFVLFANIVVVIRRADTLMLVLLAGVLGFVAAFSGAVLSELGGPPVLGVLVAVVALWALFTWRSGLSRR